MAVTLRRGNAASDALRHASLERCRMHSHAERGNDVLFTLSRLKLLAVMTKRIVFGLVLVFVTGINVYADEIPLNPSHPDQYTVIKNDTLWGIAEKFLKHPWQWPELWKANDKIKVPNLIYPGDIVYLTSSNGRPQIRLLERKLQVQDSSQSTCIIKDERVKNGRSEFPISKDGKLLPCIRELDINPAIALIPYEKIAAFLSLSKVVSENNVSQAPYVVDIAEEHLIAGVGDRLYVHGLTEPERHTYRIYRKGDSYISPDNGDVLGYDLSYIADATLQQFSDPATLMITQSNSEVLHGDWVMAKTDEEFTLNYFPKPPQLNVNATIIRIFGGLSQVGSLGVVAIDKGIEDGISEGHVLTIVESGQRIKDLYQVNNKDMIKLPDEEIGTLMVFRTFERVSYALVMRATQNIHLLDKVKTP